MVKRKALVKVRVRKVEDGGIRTVNLVRKAVRATAKEKVVVQVKEGRNDRMAKIQKKTDNN